MCKRDWPKRDWRKRDWCKREQLSANKTALCFAAGRLRLVVWLHSEAWEDSIEGVISKIDRMQWPRPVCAPCLLPPAVPSHAVEFHDAKTSPLHCALVARIARSSTSRRRRFRGTTTSQSSRMGLDSSLKRRHRTRQLLFVSIDVVLGEQPGQSRFSGASPEELMASLRLYP